MTTPDAPFEHPWQAQLFALTVALNDQGHFTWAEWSAVLGPRVQDAEADSYWETWAAALVVFLETLGIAERALVDDLASQWQGAARATPHGSPVTLTRATPPL